MIILNLGEAEYKMNRPTGARESATLAELGRRYYSSFKPGSHFVPSMSAASDGYSICFPCYESALVGQITDARRESEPKQVHQGKLKIREAGRIADEAPLRHPQG